MALFPCEQHGGRYKGPQQTAYPAVLNGSTVLRRRRRLCTDCFVKLSAWCDEHLVLADSEVSFAICCVCAADEAPDAVFVTLYPRNQERVDFWGRACATHSATEVRQALFRVPEGVQPPEPVAE